jgi:AraC-like DNA-binding protein
MSYHEHSPQPGLVPWLACTWERQVEGGPPIRVLPDGCVDVIWIEGVGTQLVGANTTAFLVSLHAGTRVVGARLRPGAAPALLGVCGEAVRDARLPIEDVWGSDGARLAAALDEHADPFDCLRAKLLDRAARAMPPDPLVGEAVTRLARPDVTVAGLAAALSVSERQLRRRVSAAVGYGPKRLARVLRLRSALDAARAGDDLAGAAIDAGYADQAHFANDCRLLAGASPSIVLAA